jgi:hypothetical protein
MEDQVLVSLVAILTFGWGTAVSYVQERFGKFEDLSPRMKQLINAVLAFVLPLVVVVVQPYWKAEFGDINQVLTAVLLMGAPVLAWVVSQVMHQVDLWFKDKHDEYTTMKNGS